MDFWEKKPIRQPGESLIDYIARYNLWYYYRKMKNKGKF